MQYCFKDLQLIVYIVLTKFEFIFPVYVCEVGPHFTVISHVKNLSLLYIIVHCDIAENVKSDDTVISFTQRAQIFNFTYIVVLV